MATIPASQIVAVNPAIIGAGGSALAVNGLILTTNNRVPIGSILAFPLASSVATFFGQGTTEADVAAKYFAGFDNSNVKPASISFAQYNIAAVPAWLRGGNVSAMTVAQINAIPASTIKITVAGTIFTSGSIVLTTAASPSAAAAVIQAAFPTFAGTVTYDSVSGAYVFTTTATGATQTLSQVISNVGLATTCTTTGTVLTVGGTVTGTFGAGDVVTGTDATNTIPAGTTIVNQLTGATGLAGTYTISAAAAPGNMASAAVTAYSADGVLAATLGLTTVLGATGSVGAAIATPTPFMNAVVNQTTNWVTFMTAFDPDAGSGNTQKLLFAAWTAAQNRRYMYVCWDTDITPTQSTAATGSLGNILTASASDGTLPLWTPTYAKAATVCGAFASIDFTQQKGRITLAFKSQTGLTADVTDATTAANLIANGYNYYGTYSTAAQGFTFFYPGSVTGAYKWADAYVNEIWLNNAFQLALMTLLTSVKSVPYDNTGYSLIRAACQDPINQGLNFGAFGPGVLLSALQISEVNTAAGLAIDGNLSSQGYYLQVLPAIAQVRGVRGSPPMTFWYCDAGAVQKISLASVAVQ